MDKLLTVKEVAELLHCHPQSVYRNEELPFSFMPGIGKRYKVSDIEKHIENNTIKPPQNTLQFLYNQQFTLTNTPENGIILPSKTGGISEMAKSKSKARYNFGYGAIYQRKTANGKIRWYLDYRDGNGKRIQKVAPLATTKEEAALALKDEMGKVFNKEYGIKEKNQNIGFKEFAKIYFQDYLTVERKNWKSDGYRMGKAVQFFKDLELKEITPQMIRKFKKERQSEGNSERTINRYLALLKRMFNVAIEDGLARENPVKKVKLFSEKDTRRERILGKEEEKKLLEECAEHLRLVVITALHTGMRKGEILNLKWSNIDFSRKEILVEKTKSKKTRFIPINKSLYEKFEMHQSMKNRGDLVFPYKSIRTAFENACKRANVVDFTFHDLRRTFGTRLLEKGIDIVTIQKLYGHSSPLVTQLYLHPNDEISREAVELLVDDPCESMKNKTNLLHNCDMKSEKKSSKEANLLFSLN